MTPDGAPRDGRAERVTRPAVASSASRDTRGRRSDTGVLNEIGPFAKPSTLAGLIPSGAAIACAIRPTERKLPITRPVSLGAIFAAICALARATSLMFQSLATTSAAEFDRLRVCAGLAEAFLPVFVSFGFLAAGRLPIAVGTLRRTP